MLKEAYLDSANRYWDYRTAHYSGDGDIFDKTKTGVSYYQDFLDNPQYMIKSKNLVGTIVKMSPKEYFEACAGQIFPNATVADLKASRSYNIEQLASDFETVLTKYHKKLCMPYLNYADHQQEGLHRMLYAGNTFGWDMKQSVLVVDYYDKDLQKSIDDLKHKQHIESKIYNAVRDACKFRYTDTSEFVEELEWCLSREFRHEDVDVSEDLTYKDAPTALVCTFLGIKFEVEKEDIQFINNFEDLDEQYVLSDTTAEDIVTILDRGLDVPYKSLSELLEDVTTALVEQCGIDARYCGRSIFVGDTKIIALEIHKHDDLYILTDYSYYL